MKRPMSKAKALVNLQAAQEALEEAQREHEREFISKLAELCHKYGLLVTANGAEGSRLEVVECAPGTVTPGDFE
jgi:hypothetical protein